jgi:TRAP-type C4-dicarboxylate transport system permease small subunit
MIWVALLAISSGIALRGHIGLMSFVGILPVTVRRGLLIFADLVTLSLFTYLFVVGIPFALGGFKREAMIFGVSMGPFFTAVPVAAFMASVQMLLTLMRDLGTHADRPRTEENII